MSEVVVNTVDELFRDPVPEMPDPLDTKVDLLYGLPGISGKTAVVREMTGEDEEFMASLGNRSELPYPEYISHLLKRTVLQIGDIDVQKNPEVIEELTVGDRDMLFLGLVKATYGPTKEFVVTCSACEQENNFVVDIDTDFPISGDIENVNENIKVTLRNGKQVLFHPPTVADSRFVAKKGKTVAEQNTLMISRCVLSDIPNSDEWASRLNMGDRRKIVQAILDAKVGPVVGEVNDPCSHCGETITVVMDWVSLLLG